MCLPALNSSLSLVLSVCRPDLIGEGPPNKKQHLVARTALLEAAGAVGTIIVDHGFSAAASDQEIVVRYIRKENETATKPVLFLSKARDGAKTPLVLSAIDTHQVRAFGEHSAEQVVGQRLASLLVLGRAAPLRSL